MDVLGIDIGSVSVKYVRWRGKKDKGIIVSTGDYLYRGSHYDLEEILLDIAGKEGINNEIAVGITSQEITKKTFTIPLLPKNEIEEAARWAASKAIPLQLEEMNYENLFLGIVDERGTRKNEFLFVGATHDYVERIRETFAKVGFKKITLLTDSGLSCLPYVEKKKKEPFVVIDVGGRQTGIYIFGEGKLKLAREILTASESFSDVLVTGMGFPSDEAEATKIGKGFADEAGDAFLIPLERLAGEIQRTFSVYRVKYPKERFENVYITGKAARIPHFIERLQGFFSENLQLLSTNIHIENEYLLAYFLAKYRDSIINLMPEEVKRSKKERIYKQWIKIASAAVIVILIFVTLNLFHSVVKMKNDIADKRGQIAKYRQQLAMMHTTLADLRYGEILSAKKELTRKNVSFRVLLEYLSTGMPGNVSIREIVFDAIGEDRKEHEPAPSLKAPGAGTKTKEQGCSLMVRGYVTGNADKLEARLRNFTLYLERSGFVTGPEVVERALRESGTAKIMEFTVHARCAEYEI